MRSRAMIEDAALVEEAPSHRRAMQMFMPMRGQDSFCTAESGGVGYSLPGLVGMALGRPDIRTVCLIGDGSAMYSIQALWTAARRKLPLTVVVINNAGYGAMRSFSQVMQVRNVPGLELPRIDFVQIARGMGCDAIRVSKAPDLAPALSRGLAHADVSLIELMEETGVPAESNVAVWCRQPAGTGSKLLFHARGAKLPDFRQNPPRRVWWSNRPGCRPATKAPRRKSC